MTRDELIERLEKATEGSRELDAIVDCFLKGRRISRADHQRVYWIKGIGCGAIDVIAKPAEVSAYTTDLNAALAQARTLTACEISLSESQFGVCRAELNYVHDKLPRASKSGPCASLPLAVCVALLKALKEQNNG